MCFPVLPVAVSHAVFCMTVPLPPRPSEPGGEASKLKTDLCLVLVRLFHGIDLIIAASIIINFEYYYYFCYFMN